MIHIKSMDVLYLQCNTTVYPRDIAHRKGEAPTSTSMSLSAANTTVYQKTYFYRKVWYQHVIKYITRPIVFAWDPLPVRSMQRPSIQ
jgi:hypothetical protein